MNIPASLLAAGILLLAMPGAGAAGFEESFHGKLSPDWTWIREDPAAWRSTDRGLEIRVQPGNMWGPANNARNVLVRPLPMDLRDSVQITVRLHNRPTEQYEQVDLVWYYDDGHMVKIGQEQVDGQWSIVMGREAGNRTRTLAIIPIETDTVWVRLRVEDREIHGAWRPDGENDWRKAGHATVPQPMGGEPKISLQVYQGPKGRAHWARIDQLEVVKLPKSER